MNEVNRSIFSGMQILSEKKWIKDQAVIIEDNVITALIPTNMIKHHLPAKRYEFPSDAYLVPGLIDLHIHGAQGKDVMDASVKALDTIAHALAAEGVTGFLATTMTVSDERLEAVLKIIPEAMTKQEGAAVLGVHLEGPFIAKSRIGAQQAENTQVPDIDSLTRWQTLSKDAIKLLTMAPELPEAIDFIKDAREMGIIVSAGHTNATYAETMAAINAGCTHATHLFNAMRGILQREPGAAGALLLSDKVMAEVIVDAFHLHPSIIELAVRVKGRDRLLLVSDALRAKCLGDGQYELGGQMVEVKKGKATLADGTLAGSTLRLPEAIKNMVKYTGCSLEDAFQMASYNPARVLGLDIHKGSIEVGKHADLAVFDAKLEVLLTMREGREIFTL